MFLGFLITLRACSVSVAASVVLVVPWFLFISSKEVRGGHGRPKLIGKFIVEVFVYIYIYIYIFIHIYIL